MTSIINPLLSGIPNYIAGLDDLGAATLIADLSLNENRLGPSPHAVAAFQAEACKLASYPDGTHRALKQIIADKFAVPADHIACGAGSNELITLLARLFAGPGDEILYPQFSFMMFRLSAMRAGATPVVAPSDAFSLSVDSLIASVTARTRAVFLANPNNPTGAHTGWRQIHDLAERLPRNVPLIIDSAYSEYVDDPDYTDGSELLQQFENVVVLRTFSKIFGLASLRIGWCVCAPAIVDCLERLRGPYTISGPALAAASAALADDAHIQAVKAHNALWRTTMTSALQASGIAITPSQGNFLLCSLANPDQVTRLYGYLRENGLMVRRLKDYGLDACLRITIGTAEDNALLIDLARQFMAGENA